jgi:hypothetical protein
LDKDLQREGRRSAAMRTQVREIGGKGTESRDRIGRSRRQRRGGAKESSAAAATRSQAQHRLITLLHTSDLSLSENTKKKKKEKKQTISAVRLRTKRKKIQLWDTLNQRGKNMGFFKRFIERAAMEGSLSSAGEQRREETEA